MALWAPVWFQIPPSNQYTFADLFMLSIYLIVVLGFISGVVLLLLQKGRP